ncbi:MAG: hypothetical protein DQL93_0090 (endogenous virus) [Lactobacillus phage ViSo-2018b]|nr:MAG: hypothetical protein DQL93_0090 [Lactobacillus phage ViSo-2018b]
MGSCLKASFGADHQDGENTAHTHAMFEIPVIIRPAMSLSKEQS